MKNIKGQSLFEVVLALAVITAIIVAVIILAVEAIKNANFSKTNTEATRYAQEAVEWLRGQRDADFQTFRGNALQVNWCLKELNFNDLGTCQEIEVIPGTRLRREVIFDGSSITDTSIGRVEVRVYWNDAQGSHEVSTITSFTDWKAQ